MLTKLLCSIGGLREILLGKLLQSNLAVNSHKNICHQGDKGLVSANIRSRLLAPDVLLASRKRKHEPALSVAIGSLADEASGHLADVSFPRGDDAAIGTAESKRDAE